MAVVLATGVLAFLLWTDRAKVHIAADRHSTTSTEATATTAVPNATIAPTTTTTRRPAAVVAPTPIAQVCPFPKDSYLDRPTSPLPAALVLSLRLDRMVVQANEHLTGVISVENRSEQTYDFEYGHTSEVLLRDDAPVADNGGKTGHAQAFFHHMIPPGRSFSIDFDFDTIGCPDAAKNRRALPPGSYQLVVDVTANTPEAEVSHGGGLYLDPVTIHITA